MRKSSTAVSTGVVAGLTLVASPLLGLAPLALAASPSITWGPVTTVWNGHPQSEVSLTTDNGMVVAAWVGPHFNGAYVAVRPDGGDWTTPQRVSDDAATV